MREKSKEMPMILGPLKILWPLGWRDFINDFCGFVFFILETVHACLEAPAEWFPNMVWRVSWQEDYCGEVRWWPWGVVSMGETCTPSAPLLAGTTCAPAFGACPAALLPLGQNKLLQKWLSHTQVPQPREVPSQGFTRATSLPGTIGQLPVKGSAAGDGGLALREKGLALQPVGRAGHRGDPGQGLQGGRGHAVPRGVPPERGLVLAGGSLAVQLVLHHGDPAELRTPSVSQEEMVRGCSALSH